MRPPTRATSNAASPRDFAGHLREECLASSWPNGGMKLTEAPPATQSTSTSASSAISVAVTDSATAISTEAFSGKVGTGFPQKMRQI
jgi:hypothetical protein